MAIKQEIIKLKEIQRWLNHKGFNDNKECLNCQYIKHHRKQWKTINGILYKRCPHCQQYLPLDAFNIKSDGKCDSWCRNCHKEYLKNYKRTNK